MTEQLTFEAAAMDAVYATSVSGGYSATLQVGVAA